MRIAKLEIKNYRSIKHLSISCGDLVTLLGPNNHGKSNLLTALEFGLTTSAKPVELDFFAGRDDDDNELWVEITFDGLTAQERNTFKRYVLNDGSIRIRKTAVLSDGSAKISYNGWVDEPNKEWLLAENAGQYTTRAAVNETELHDLVPPTGRVTKAMIQRAQQQYIEQNRTELNFSKRLEQGPLLGQRNVSGGVLPEFFLIPAVRDLTDEVKIRATTTFGRLMKRAVREMTERDERFIGAKTQLESVIKSLNERGGEEETPNQLAELEQSIEDQLRGWDVIVNIEVTPPEMEKIFELGTHIHLDDGVRTTADRKGHGLQRATMFALLRAWSTALQADREASTTGTVTARRRSRSAVFAMEEPELFLHPHAQRRLSASLREISNTPEHQVFLCTHSTHFVDLSHYKEVAIISKENFSDGSQVRQCTKDLFEGDDHRSKKDRFHMAHWVNPDRGELFFARRVVFVEGETEKVILPFLAEKLNLSNHDVSIIDCGSKYNLRLYATIADAFTIPYLVIHDEDPVPDPIPSRWTPDQIRSKQQTFGENDKIAAVVQEPLGKVQILSPDFENVSGVSKRRGKKISKPLAALNHFEATPVEEIPPRIEELVRTVYDT